MKLIKAIISLSGEDLDLRIPKTYEREVWIAEGTGLACTPNGNECIPYLATCDQWILTHIESGKTVGPAFPADKQYAKIWLEEIVREGLDFTQDRHSINAKYDAISRKLRTALNRTNARWDISQVQQLPMFEEVAV
jgi:hypothetical protein